MVDASLLAYAAVSYARHKYEDDEVTVIYCSESKGRTYRSDVGSEVRAHGGSVLSRGLRLTRKVSELLEIPFENCTLWTDSKDVIL